MLYNYGYKHTLRISRSYCFSTATMEAQQRRRVTLYAQCHSLFLIILCRIIYRCVDRFIREEAINNDEDETRAELSYSPVTAEANKL